MHVQADTGALLDTIVGASVAIVPGARWAGILHVDGRTIIPRVPTDPIVAELDELQRRDNAGPCLTALREHHTVRIGNTATDERWPNYGHAAAARGVRSMLSFRLFMERQTLGSLNLYGDRENAFSDESEVIGGIIAQHAAVAIVGSSAETQFQAALAGRDIIGQAKGILMYRDQVTGLQAFALLTRVSQETNTKLIDVAKFLVAEQESAAGPLERSG
jgi:GAF domain-containing protein